MASALVNSPVLDSPEYQAFREFAELTAEKRALTNRINEINPRLEELEPQLLAYLGEGGYDMVKLLGFTFSPHREPWVYPADGLSRQAVCAALKEAGLSYLVNENYNTRSLTKYVRELEEHYQLLDEAEPETALLKILPPALQGVVNIKPAYRLQVLDRRGKDQK